MTDANSTSKTTLWAGRISSGLVVLFMLFDAGIHAAKPQPVVDAFLQLGVPLSLAVPLSILELLCVVLYAVPRTAVLGAILLTGYLGGAVAVNLRIGAPMGSTVLFPVYLGLLAWGGLWWRNAKLRALIPLGD